jgi:hypothetical protein
MVVAIKPRAEYKFRVTAMLLFYILQENDLNKTYKFLKIG